MSLSRSMFNEFRPVFRLFDDIARATRPSYGVQGLRHFDRAFDDLLVRHPAVDLSEQGDKYVVEAEVPGVKKENLDVRVGEDGRSLTIEGRVFSNGIQAANGSPSSTNGAESTSTEVVQTSEKPVALASEREFASHFTRTIWLPRHVNASKIQASLEDGILRLQIPKAEEQGSIKVEIQ